MALWVFTDNFESGDFTGWDGGETDVSSKLDVAHYSDLARNNMPQPYSGAYCARWNFRDSGAAAFITDGDFDIATGETLWLRFVIYIPSEFITSTTSGDGFTFLVLYDTAGASSSSFFTVDPGVDVVMSFNYEGSGSGNADFNRYLDQWVSLEYEVHNDQAAANGYINVYLTAEGAEISSTPFLSVTGKQNSDNHTHMDLGSGSISATTMGYILVDEVKTSATRIGAIKDRFSTTKTVNRSGHVFTGPGIVRSVSMIASDQGDEVVTVYDTDTGQAQGASKKVVLNAATNAYVRVEATDVPFEVVRGCYVEITGTAAGTREPEVTVEIERASGWFSEGNMRRYANQRRI